jgi:hypothetical protein
MAMVAGGGGGVEVGITVAAHLWWWRVDVERQ